MQLSLSRVGDDGQLFDLATGLGGLMRKPQKVRLAQVLGADGVAVCLRQKPCGESRAGGCGSSGSILGDSPRGMRPELADQSRSAGVEAVISHQSIGPPCWGFAVELLCDGLSCRTRARGRRGPALCHQLCHIAGVSSVAMIIVECHRCHRPVARLALEDGRAEFLGTTEAEN